MCNVNVKLERGVVTKVLDSNTSILYVFSDGLHYVCNLSGKDEMSLVTVTRDKFLYSVEIEDVSYRVGERSSERLTFEGGFGGFYGPSRVVSHSFIPENALEYDRKTPGCRWYVLLTDDGELRVEPYPVGWDLYRGGWTLFHRDDSVPIPLTFEDYQNQFCHSDSELVGSKNFGMRPCVDKRELL